VSINIYKIEGFLKWFIELPVFWKNIIEHEGHAVA
jgi:hypothetical protein